MMNKSCHGELASVACSAPGFTMSLDPFARNARTLTGRYAANSFMWGICPMGPVQNNATILITFHTGWRAKRIYGPPPSPSFRPSAHSRLCDGF